MSSRALAKIKKQNSTTFLPVFGKKLSGRSFMPQSANEGRDVSNPGFGHNFGDVQVESPSFKQSCPLALSGPAHCPFGGACHTCAPTIQTKLKIGQPNDKYEQEADRVAEQVMRMPNPQPRTSEQASGITQSTDVQRKCIECGEDEGELIQRKPINSNITPLIQRQTDEEKETLHGVEEGEVIQTKQITPLIQCQESLVKEEDEDLIQAKIAGDVTPEVTPAINSGIQSLQGVGRPLSGSERSFFELRFGADFSGVWVHNDMRAANVARLINAHAFTSGRNVVFGAGEYSSGSLAGKKLLAHELTHVVQQGGEQNTIQAKYKLNELKKKKTPKVDSAPDTYFYKGSPANTKDKKALIIAGIHAKEVSPCELGKEVQSKLDSGSIKPDLHTVIVPCVVPCVVPCDASRDASRDVSCGRGAGTGTKHVKDLNRQFGGEMPSNNPKANKITKIVNEFDPDQTVSIHAISKKQLGGIFLDPKNAGTYPATYNKKKKENVFTGNVNNEEAMRLTEDMVTATRRSEGKKSSFETTGGNVASTKMPKNKYPSQGTSSFNLLYPQQNQIDATKRPTSLGVWMAGLGKTVITMELPGYCTPKSKWQHFVPALERFMHLPGNRAYSPQVYTEDEKLNYLIGTLGRKKAGLDFGKKAQKIDLGKGNAPHKLGGNLNLRESSFRCLEAMMKDAKAAGHDIIPFSGTRLFKKQKGIWEKKYSFKNIGYDWGNLDPKALKKKYPIDCAGLKDTEVEWHSNTNTKSDSARAKLHKKCWMALKNEEKAKEILKTSSGPGFSRHHWGTEVDINSDKPKKWETDKALLALYAWLTKNAHKYGYYEAFNAGRPSGKGYTQEKWHWSFAPISVALQEDYEKKILKAGEAGRTLLKKKMEKVAGKNEALKLFNEYVETINPDLRGNKKIDRPACMPIGTGADIPAKRSPALSFIGDHPPDYNITGSTAELHKFLTDQYSRETGAPSKPGTQYSTDYAQWLVSKNAKNAKRVSP